MAYMPKTKVKALGKVMLQYIKISAETGVCDPDLEALRPFFGKKGQVLKRPLRSKKQQAKFEEAVKTAKSKYGSKPSSRKMPTSWCSSALPMTRMLKKSRPAWRNTE